MIKVVWDQGFKKAYRKKIRDSNDLKKRFWNSIELFSNNPFNPRLRTHKLTGELDGLWAFSVAFDCRVVFEFIKEDEVLFIDIGSHEEVY